MELGQECMDLCFDGHSVLITGQAGTGKTTLLKKIVSAIKCNKTKKVQIDLCAATGISTLQFSSRAQTLHSWAGLKDGRYSFEQLVILFEAEDNYSTAKDSIINKCVALCFPFHKAPLSPDWTESCKK